MIQVNSRDRLYLSPNEVRGAKGNSAPTSPNTETRRAQTALQLRPLGEPDFDSNPPVSDEEIFDGFAQVEVEEPEEPNGANKAAAFGEQPQDWV